jgi:Tfp pilus assembly protein PilX
MIRSIVNNLRREEGSIVVTAVIVMSLMIAIGLATYSTVDTQQAQSRIERERDSSFNLGESAFYAQAFILGRDWPTEEANQYPEVCTEGTEAGTRGCPTPDDLRSALDSPALPDLSSDAEWTIRVRDNGSPATRTDYDHSTDDQPTYDFNGDDKLWVRADGVAKGHTRSIVGLLQREKLGESVAQNVITAGRFYTSNNGKKVIVDTQGNSATGSQVVVRCTPPPPPANPTDNACISYERDKGQVSPDRVYSGQQAPNMSKEQADRFEAEARANNTYYTSCPQSLSGRVVFVETSSMINCKYNGGVFNTQASPGLVVFTNGHLELGGGKVTYYGLVYMLNPDPRLVPLPLSTTATRFTMHANGTLVGGVSVDGDGGVDAGSDKFNIIFDGGAFAVLETHGTAGLVQNSWRELPPGI